MLFNNPDQGGPRPQFFADAASGNLPAFSLVDPYANFSEEDGDISVGEAYAALFIDAVMTGPAWEKTALIWIYDEHGGWYDHVPPQPAVKPDNVPPKLAAGDIPGAYDYTGFRVPCCVVSAWSKKDYVSHQVFDHTSDPEAGRDQVEPSGPDLPGRQRPQHVGLLRPDGEDGRRSPSLPAWRHPANPFSSPAALPANSMTRRSRRCSTRRAPSCPPARSPRQCQLSSYRRTPTALIATQQKRIQKEIRAPRERATLVRDGDPSA